MDIFKTFKTDESKEQDGVWVQLDDGKSRLKIARNLNARYKAAQQLKMQRYKMAAKVKTIPDDVWNDMFNELIAETILVDWEGITRDGEPYPYSKENALQAIGELKDFREMVMGFAADMDNFKQELDETTEKNSVRP